MGNNIIKAHSSKYIGVLTRHLNIQLCTIGHTAIKMSTLLLVFVLLISGYVCSYFVTTYSYALVILVGTFLLGVCALKRPDRITYVLLAIVIFPSFMQFFIELPYLINEFNVLYGMILVGFLFKAVMSKSLHFRRPTLIFPIILYSIVLLLGAMRSYYSSQFVSSYPYDKITIFSAGFIKPIAYISLYLVGFFFMKRKRITTFLVIISIAILILIGSAVLERYGLVFKYSTFGLKLGRWGGGFVTNANVSAVILAMYSLVIFLYSISYTKLHKKSRIYFYSVCIISLPLIMYMGSRSTIISFAITFTLFVFIFRRKYIIYVVCILMVIYSLMPTATKERLEYRHRDEHTLRVYSAGRSVIWVDAIEYMKGSKDKLVFGDGWESFRYKTRLGMNTHNVFLSHLVFYGLAGVLVLLYFIFMIFRIILKCFYHPLGMALAFAFILFILNNLFHDIHFAGRELVPFFFLVGVLEGKQQQNQSR